MKTLSRFFTFLENNKYKLNNAVPLFLCLYFLFVSFPYLFARIPFLNSIFSNSTIANVLRLGFLFLYCLFGLLLLIANKYKLNIILIIVLLLLIALSLISNFVSPDNIISYSMFFSAKVRVTNVKIEAYSKLLDSIRFTGGCLFFYFLVVSYAPSFTNKNQLTYVLLPAIVIALIGVFYSLTFDLKTLIAVIRGEGNPEAAKSIFHSKNAFGIFLVQGAIAVTFVFFIDSRRLFRLFVIFMPVLFIIALFVNCKSAAICIFVLLLFSYFYSIIYYFKKRIWVSIVMTFVMMLASLLIVLFFSIPFFHQIGILANIYDKIIDGLTNFDISSLIGRTGEWAMVPIMTNGIYKWIGFSSAVGYSVVMAFTAINGSTAANGVYDLHNAYVSYYAYHGIIGCILLGLIVFQLGYLGFKIYKKHYDVVLLVLMIFIVSVLFGMSETYMLFLSMSANTFVSTFTIVVPLVFLYFKEIRLHE